MRGLAEVANPLTGQRTRRSTRTALAAGLAALAAGLSLMPTGLAALTAGLAALAAGLSLMPTGLAAVTCRGPRAGVVAGTRTLIRSAARTR